MRFITSLSAIVLVVCASASGAVARRVDNSYRVTILVSNETGEAPLVDDKLVNAWGIAAGATTPWWVANNGTDSSTAYTGAGVKVPQVNVNVPGDPTGMVHYDGTQFEVAAGQPALFMWAAEDGTISAWNPNVDPSNAIVKVPSDGGIYKGLAIHGDTLFTTDFEACEVEAINGTFTEFDTTGGFEDDSIPKGYCPFGIQAIGDSIFVTYAKKKGKDDQGGANHGFVREFDTDSNLVAKVASRDHLNSPWGMAQAPSNFGKFSNCLLVGNFGDGKILAFCADSRGKYHHHARLEENGKALKIDGLWGIGFGNGGPSGDPNVLYFAAGPDDEENGYFGKVDAVQ